MPLTGHVKKPHSRRGSLDFLSVYSPALFESWASIIPINNDALFSFKNIGEEEN